MDELNGFKIDKYNQYNLEEGSKKSICPKCSADRKPLNQKVKVLMLDWLTGIGTCQHCGEVMQLHTYKKKEIKKEYKRPEWQNNTKLSDKLVSWFESRSISQFTLRQMKIAEGMEWMPQTNKEVNTVQFPYFRDDVLINIKYRCPLPKGKKGFKMFKDAEKIPWNIDNIRTTKEAVIVEGEMDGLSYVDDGIWNVVSCPNGSVKQGNVNLEWLDNSYESFENKEKIYLAFDNDEAGQHVQKELIRRLGAEKCFLVDLKEYNDPNELYQKQGKGSLKESLENAKPVPLENIITYNDLKDELHNFYLNGSAPGYQIGLQSFDEKFSTYTGQYIVVTGIPSSGKSDFVDQMCVGYNLKYGWKIAYASPENKPNYLHADKIAKKFAGYQPENKIQLNSSGWKIVEERIHNDITFIDYDSGYDLKSVLAKGVELVKRKGIKCLVIDPYNKVRLKESLNKNVNEYTTDYLTAIDNFCRKYDVLVILVAHPVKMKKALGEVKMPEPTFYDIKGGGEFYDMSYHGILVHRDYEKQLVKIKNLKVKFTNLGENQAETHFKWSPKNGRYTEIKGDPNGESDTIIPMWDNDNWVANLQKEYSNPEIGYEEEKETSWEDIHNGFMKDNEPPF